MSSLPAPVKVARGKTKESKSVFSKIIYLKVKELCGARSNMILRFHYTVQK